MTVTEFKEVVSKFVREYIAGKEEFDGKDFDYVFDEVLEKVINDPVCEGVEMGLDDLSSSHPEYDYCDAHEEEWKINGEWYKDG